MTSERADHALARTRYEHAVQYPLFVLSLGFIVGLLMEYDPQSSQVYQNVGSILVWSAWTAFAIYYIIGLVLTANRKRYVLTHILELVAIVFPPLRILLLGRVARTVTSGAKRRLGGRVRIYALYLTTLVVVLATALEIIFERQAPGSNIRTVGDALWWASETLSTVGYGDFYPVTVQGRLVAVALFINGIALLSAVTATIASKILEGGEEAADQTEPDVTLVAMNSRLINIERHLELLAASSLANVANSTTELNGPRSDTG